MMRTKAKMVGLSPANGGSGAGRGESGGDEWEVRPGGMLVQKRSLDPDRNPIPPPPTIRVRVKYGSTYHEVSINSQATFGELKKMLSGPTGLHHQDQKLFYKDKERDSNAFLDIVGVKDRSKMVLVEDPISQEKRYLEMRRNAKMEKASKSISAISLEVDRLAGRVSALESVISRGGKIAEMDVLNLIELLMNQLLKLDGIVADGDAKLQRKMQVKRVQKCVETLDVLKVKNSKNSVSSVAMNNGNGNHSQATQQSPNGIKSTPIQHYQQSQRHANGHFHAQTETETQEHEHRQQQQQQQHQHQEETSSNSRHSTSGTVVTTNWETFDSTPPRVPALPSATSTSSVANNTILPKFDWEKELFD